MFFKSIFYKFGVVFSSQKNIQIEEFFKIPRLLRKRICILLIRIPRWKNDRQMLPILIKVKNNPQKYPTIFYTNIQRFITAFDSGKLKL